MMNKKLIYISIVLIVLVGIASFLDEINNSGAWYGANDYTHVIPVDSSVQKSIARACLDCHSNFTNPVWYDNIVPLSFLIKHHVDEGKHELNFSEFASYSVKKQKHKLHELIEQVEEGEMPMEAYVWMHPTAKLSAEEKQNLIAWSKQAIAQLEAKPTTDSTAH